MKKLLSILLIFIASFILWKCASQTTPTGGPKDETPPTLKKSVPANNQTNFKGRKIDLTFDELIKLDNEKEEIIITPTPSKSVSFTVKQNKVTIEPKEGLKENTTYSISFREGVQDINEGNPAKNLRLAFSTGPSIDSLQISGKVTQSLTEKIPEKITIALYQQDTFNILKHSPVYFTMSEKNGSFKIDNLKPGKYNVYAFDDKNKNLKVDSQTEKFGFLSEPITSERKPIKKIKDTLAIALYQVDSRLLKINSIRNTGTITQIKLNKDLLSYSIYYGGQAKLYHSFGSDQSEVNVYNDLNLNDSLSITLQGTDSISQKIDSTFFVKRIESKLPPEKFTSKLTTSIDPETYNVESKILFSKPIKFLNLDSIYLTPDPVPERKSKEKSIDKKKNDKNTEPKIQIKKDTVALKRAREGIATSLPSIKDDTKKDTTAKPIPKPIRISVLSDDIKIDSSKRILSITKKIDKKLITSKVKQISLVLEEAFLISIEKDSSKREIKSMPIANTEDAGILHIEVETEYKNYEIRLVGPNGDIVQKVRNVKKHSFKYLQAQEYKLMFYADLNDNGIWDAQNVLERKVQEPTFFYKAEGKYTFPIRSTWEVGPLIIKF